MTTLFTADTHFGHENVIRFCGRPYASAEEMDEALIANWNAVVRPTDDIYHLGDFAYRCHPDRMLQIFSRLNGRKFLILGNHDKIGVVSQLTWAQKPTHYKEIAVDGQRIVLFHYGMRVWNAMRRGAIQLYGHSHGNLPDTDRSLDVGVDRWNYFPVTLDQIRERMAQSPPHIGEPDSSDDESEEA